MVIKEGKMNSKKFEIICIVMFVIIIIVLSIIIVSLSIELSKTRDYRQYNEAELDSAVTYLGLEKCTIIEGIPYFYYGDEKYNVIAFCELLRRKPTGYFCRDLIKQKEGTK